MDEPCMLDESICDTCSQTFPIDDTRTCDDCGLVLCPDCSWGHDCEDHDG